MTAPLSAHALDVTENIEPTHLTSFHYSSLEQDIAQKQLVKAVTKGQILSETGRLTVSERQLLAKTARQLGQLSLAKEHYQILSKNEDLQIAKDGLLGAWLVDIDARRRTSAEQQALQYQQRFTQDQSFVEAKQYHVQVFGVDDDSNNTHSEQEILLQQYRQASSENRFVAQTQMQHQQPQWFNENDQMWLQLSQQQEIARSTPLSSHHNAILLQQARTTALQMGHERADNPMFRQAALQTILDSSLKLSDSKIAIDTYQQWQSQASASVTDELTFAYANNLLINHQHHAALKQFKQLPEDFHHDELHDRTIAAYADAGLMSRAQKKRQQWTPLASQNDYTHNYRLENPYALEKEFWNIRLLDWDGHHRQANALIDAYLESAPANISALKLKGDLRRWQGFHDDALAQYEQAAYYMHPDDRVNLQSNRATVFLDTNDVQSARKAIASLPDYQPIKRDLTDRLLLQDAAYWNSQFTLIDTTSPADMKNEWQLQSIVASQRNQNGHRAYVEHQIQVSPHDQQQSQAQRVGVGVQINQFPTQWDLAIGSGSKLNHKPYIHLDVNHRFNQYISAGLNIQKNSDATPLRALEQDVYVNSIGSDFKIHLGADVDAGMGLTLNDFDDGNIRQEAFVFISSTLWQKDRLSLKNYTRADFQKNRHIPQAAYYNPSKAWSYATEMGVEHRYPLDKQVTLTQSFNGGIGHYHQDHQRPEATWVLRYGQNWDFQNRYQIGFHIGRKRAIYDGNPEYSNFIGLNTSMRF